MNAIVRFLSRPISPVPRAFSPVLMLIALAPRPAEAAPAPAPQESDAQAGSANYELAARFAPYRISEMVHSTSVDPQWIEGTDRFWYEWENADGKFFYIVDPGAGSRTLLFDNDRIAAELTRITRDPWDAQHLPIRAIRFIDEGTIQFDVQSSQEEEVEEEEEPVEPEIEEIPDIEIPDLPTTRVDPVQEEFDQRQMAENPLALVGEADEGADAFQLQSASRNRGLLRGAPPGTNAEGRYWGLVQSEIRTHLYRYPAIDRVEWQFILMLRVNEDASITILGIENVQPQNLQDELRAALADFTFVSQPPPSGVRRTNRVRLRNERD